MAAQVSDVGRVLVSVDKLTEAGNQVNLNKENPHIRHPNGEVTPLRRKGGVFVMNMWFRTPESSDEGFTGQGE